MGRQSDRCNASSSASRSSPSEIMVDLPVTIAFLVVSAKYYLCGNAKRENNCWRPSSKTVGAGLRLGRAEGRPRNRAGGRRRRRAGFASDALKDDREIVLEPSGRTGCAECASDALQDDREIVLEAVKQNGWVRHHASAALQGDREIVLEAIKQAGMAGPPRTC